MNQFQHIVSNQGILGGKPCIKGTRISVQLILEWVAVGTTNYTRNLRKISSFDLRGYSRGYFVCCCIFKKL